MACETMLKPKQTLSERIAEIKAAMDKISAKLASGAIKVKVGPQGAIAFEGVGDDRNGITDACIYRRIMATGSSLAKMKIAQAEQLAGRTVSRQALAAGIHAHGDHWHPGHKHHHR